MTESASNWANRELGSSAGVIRLPTIADKQSIVVQLAKQARREIHILSTDLEPEVYNQQEFLDALTVLTTSSHRSRVQLIVCDPDRVAKYGHRLIELARRLSSQFEIRCPIEEYRENHANFLVADRIGYVLQGAAPSSETTADFCDPRTALRLLGEFDETWQHSDPSPELRQLYL